MMVLTFLWSVGIVGFGLFGVYELLVAAGALFEDDDD